MIREDGGGPGDGDYSTQNSTQTHCPPWLHSKRLRNKQEVSPERLPVAQAVEEAVFTSSQTPPRSAVIPAAPGQRGRPAPPRASIWLCWGGAFMSILSSMQPFDLLQVRLSTVEEKTSGHLGGAISRLPHTCPSPEHPCAHQHLVLWVVVCPLGGGGSTGPRRRRPPCRRIRAWRALLER